MAVAEYMLYASRRPGRWCRDHVEHGGQRDHFAAVVADPRNGFMIVQGGNTDKDVDFPRGSDLSQEIVGESGFRQT